MTLHISTLLTLAAALAVVLGLCWSAGFRRFCRPIKKFLCGELLLRQMGEHDSTFRNPAPPPPTGGYLNRVTIPRTAWARMPGWKRSFWRCAVLAAAALIWFAPLWALVTAIVGTVVLVAATARRLLGEWRDWWTLRVASRWVEQAADHLEQDPDTPREWITCPAPRLEWDPIVWPMWLLKRVENHERLVKLLYGIKVPVFRQPLDSDDATITMHYPLALGEAAPNEAGKIACTRLEGDWEHRKDHKNAQVKLMHPARPPKFVEYDAEVNAAFDEHNIPIGQGTPVKDGETRRPNWVTVPVKDKTPHIVLSATTGWCKTSTANTLIAHVTSKGAYVMINDPKRIGFVSAFGNLDRMVRIATTVESMMQTYTAFCAEMDRRYELIEQYPEIKAAPEQYFRPWWLLEDEKGSLTSMIKAWHKKQGGPDGGAGKGTPESLETLKIILWQARAANMHVATLAQQVNLDVMIDSDGRDQYMCRIASGPQTQSAYRMLFSGTRKKVPSKKGRALIALGVDDPEQVQLAAISDDSARGFAEMGLHILDQQERERAERLDKVVSGVSPAHPVAGVPARTLASVPGQGGDGQVPDEGVNEVTAEVMTDRQAHNFSVIAGSDSEITVSRENANLFDLSGVLGNDKNSVTTSPTGSSSAGSDGAALVPVAPAGEQDVLVGNRAAAEYLGMKHEAFTKARRRHKERTGADLPGTTTRQDGTPAFDRSALAEWANQRPRAGSNASE